MFRVIIYEDNKGCAPVAEYIAELRRQGRTSKHARVNFNRIVAFIDMLAETGTRIGEPVTKHLDGEIWELRPLDNRILYAFYMDGSFILLDHFVKKSRKTPLREIERAKRSLADYRERKAV